MINREIIIKTELRPCIVAGQKALFHCWEHGGKRMHSGISNITLGIIEREDGTIHKAYPEEIIFIDMKTEHYFYENATALDFEKHEDNLNPEQDKGCEYCNGTKSLYQETRNTKIYISTFGEARTLYVEDYGKCPPHEKCIMKCVPNRTEYLINYCPNCGRNLKGAGKSEGVISENKTDANFAAAADND